MRRPLSLLQQTARESGWLWACTVAFDELMPWSARSLWPARLVSADRLGTFLTDVFRAWGMPEDQTAIVVANVLYADLRGIDSHGCAMLATYDRARTEGRLSPAPTVTIVQEHDATAVIDGGGGLGHVPATHAMEKAIALCRQSGVGVVAVRNSGHFGAAGAYAAIAAAQGFIGVTTTSTPTVAVVPTFGREPMLGTNPIAIAVPGAAGAPFLLDMATSTVSLGLLFERRHAGKAIPAGWAQDDRGAPATGARATKYRRLTPLGGNRDGGSHKGYGLSVAVEILSSLLPGGLARTPGASHAPVGHFLAAVDPGVFRPDGGFGSDVDALLDRLRRTAPTDPAQPVLVAGDVEATALQARTHSGIPLARTVLEDLRRVARSSGVPFQLDTDAS